MNSKHVMQIAVEILYYRTEIYRYAYLLFNISKCMLTYSGFGILVTLFRLKARQIAKTTITVIHTMRSATIPITPPTSVAMVTPSRLIPPPELTCEETEVKQQMTHIIVVYNHW